MLNDTFSNSLTDTANGILDGIGAGLFDPLNMTGIVAYWESGRSGLTTAQFDDLTGNANHLTASTAGTVESSVQNGFDALQGLRANSVLYTTGYISSTAHAVYLLYRTINNTHGRVWDYSHGNAHHGSDSSSTFYYDRNQAGSNEIYAGTPANWQMLGLSFASNSSVTASINAADITTFDPDNIYDVKEVRLFGAAAGADMQLLAGVIIDQAPVASEVTDLRARWNSIFDVGIV